MTRTVDLSTTIVARDHKIWKLFPGEGYKFARIMIEERVVFADVRGLPKLGTNPSAWKAEKLDELVSGDRWARQNADKDQPTDRRVSAADRATATYVRGLLMTASVAILSLFLRRAPTALYVSVSLLTSRAQLLRLALSINEWSGSTSVVTYVGWAR